MLAGRYLVAFLIWMVYNSKVGAWEDGKEPLNN
jgi:hypothetical protein